MYVFNWPFIIPVTILLYILTIVSLPFSTIMATIMLFSLIGFWSRLPGFCIMEPIRFLYMMDFVDLFSIVIAIYVSPIYAAIYSLVWNIYPWICGHQQLHIVGTLKDGGTQAFLCLFCPLFYAMTKNLVTVVVIFSVLRLILFFLVSLVAPHRTLVEQVFHTIAAGISVLIINVIYANLFGDFFSNLLVKGAAFSWTLFFIATGIIVLFAITVFGISPKEVGKRISNQVKNVAKTAQHKKKVHHHDNMEELKKLKESL